MSDLFRSDRQPSTGDVPDRDRDALIEELLLAGLSHYFADQHELAINVWTRVLFLDRGHARARAYIERARGAIAERQRKGDELLHTGTAALDRGDPGAARELVASAVEHGASHDQALALLARIERLETAARSAGPAREPVQTVETAAAATAQASRRWRWIAGGLLAGVVLCAAALSALVQFGLVSGTFMSSRPTAPPALLGSALPVPTVAEMTFAKAQVLHARGRPYEALAALNAIPSTDPLRARADELTSAIQRQLLAGARSAVPVRPETTPRRP